MIKNIDKSEEFDKLSSAQQEALFSWIDVNLIEIPSINKKRSSYHLKQLFEHSPGGFYVTHEAFKGAMKKYGFKHVNEYDSPDWFFNISQRSPCFRKNI